MKYRTVKIIYVHLISLVIESISISKVIGYSVRIDDTRAAHSNSPEFFPFDPDSPLQLETESAVTVPVSRTYFMNVPAFISST